MQAFLKLIGAKLGIDWTSVPEVTVKLFVLRKLPEIHREFIRTQHLHVVASSIAKLRDDAFVSAATADACFMVYTVSRAAESLETGKELPGKSYMLAGN